MACKEFEELIQRDIDGEILPADRAKVQQHVAACSPCRTDRDAYMRIDESLKRSSSPAAPRRDFAAEAIARATSLQVTAPRRIRRPVSPVVWAGFGIAGVAAVLGLIAWLLWLGAQPDSRSDEGVAVLPEVVFKFDENRNPPPRKDEPSLPTHRDPGYEDLRKVYRFGEVDPVAELADVNVRLVSTEPAFDRIRLLERALLGLFDGFAEACARAADVSEFTEAIRITVQDGLEPMLAETGAAGTRADAEALAERFSREYERLTAFARALPLARKPEVERILAFCAESRDAARAAVRRSEGGAPEVRRNPSLLRDLAGGAVRLARARTLPARVDAAAGSGLALADALAAASGSPSRMEEAVHYARLGLTVADQGLGSLLRRVEDDDPANDDKYGRGVEAASRLVRNSQTLLESLPEDQKARLRPLLESAAPRVARLEDWMKARTDRHAKKDGPPDVPPDRERRTPGGTDRGEGNPH